MKLWKVGVIVVGVVAFSCLMSLEPPAENTDKIISNRGVTTSIASSVKEDDKNNETQSNSVVSQNQVVWQSVEVNHTVTEPNNNVVSSNPNEEQGKEVQKNQTTNTSVEVVATNENLSNKTFAWGFRRMKDGAQPEFTASYVKPLNDYQGIYVGNKEEPVVYLTFDEGYENGYTGKILDVLKENGICATFFVTTPYVKQNEELIQRMIDEGHIVGNHTVNHPSMPSVTDDEKLKKEITGLHDLMVEKYDYEMTFLRPPKGEYSERTVKIARDLGYTTVLWSFAYDDWDVNKQKGTDYAKKMIYNNLHNGSVILLHAVSKDNTEVLDEVIKEIQNRGFEIKPLTEFEY